MILAIVGTSRLSDNEASDARKLISLLIKDEMDKNILPIKVTSGGAPGIDTIVEQVANGLRVKFIAHLPHKKEWLHFKGRNIKIASEADKVICITTLVKDQSCYHCREMHQRSGGCWTVNYAKKLGKETKVFVL